MASRKPRAAQPTQRQRPWVRSGPGRYRPQRRSPGPEAPEADQTAEAAERERRRRVFFMLLLFLVFERIASFSKRFFKNLIWKFRVGEKPSRVKRFTDGRTEDNHKETADDETYKERKRNDRRTARRDNKTGRTTTRERRKKRSWKRTTELGEDGTRGEAPELRGGFRFSSSAAGPPARAPPPPPRTQDHRAKTRQPAPEKKAKRPRKTAQNDTEKGEN